MLCLTTKPSKQKVQNLTTARSVRTYLTLHIISTKTLEFTETNSYFYSCTYEKNIVNLLPAVGRFFVNLLTDRKVVGLTQKYSLLAEDINQASNFFLLAIS